MFLINVSSSTDEDDKDVDMKLPVRIKKTELIKKLYPKYKTPLVQLEKLSVRIQYSIAYAKTYAALAPAVKKALHCQ